MIVWYIASVLKLPVLVCNGSLKGGGIGAAGAAMAAPLFSSNMGHAL